MNPHLHDPTAPLCTPPGQSDITTNEAGSQDGIARQGSRVGLLSRAEVRRNVTGPTGVRQIVTAVTHDRKQNRAQRVNFLGETQASNPPETWGYNGCFPAECTCPWRAARHVRAADRHLHLGRQSQPSQSSSLAIKI